jgi:maleate isomerase
LEEFIRLLPEGIGVIPLMVGIKSGTEEEFHKVLPVYKAKVAELAALGVDLIDIGGAPPMMVHGFGGEQDIVRALEDEYKVPITTSGGSQSAALKALGAKRFIGATYFKESLNQIFSRYFTEAGFEVAAMEGIPVAFSDVQRLSPQEIYFHTKQTFLKHKNVDAIYMLGGGWRIIDTVTLLEQDLGVPVVYDTAAKIWDVQKRLRVHQPIAGYGRLLETLP